MAVEPLEPALALERLLTRLPGLDLEAQADAMGVLAGLLRGPPGRAIHADWLAAEARQLSLTGHLGKTGSLSLGSLAVVDQWGPVFREAVAGVTGAVAAGEAAAVGGSPLEAGPVATGEARSPMVAGGHPAAGADSIEALQRLVAGMPRGADTVGPPAARPAAWPTTAATPVPYAARLFSGPLDPIRGMGRLAAALWGIGSPDEARAIFDASFYPQGAVAGVADLGTGGGEFALSLARRFPTAAAIAIDQEAVKALALPDLPPNLVNGTGFDVVHFFRSPAWAAIRRPLDRVYIIIPDDALAPKLVGAALEIVAPDGEIHILTGSLHTDSFLDLFEARGFEARSIEIPGDVAPDTQWTRIHRNLNKPLQWIVGRRRRPTAIAVPQRRPRAEDVPPLPRILKISNTPIYNRRDPALPGLLGPLFGFPLSIDDLLRAFTVDVPNYRLDGLIVTRRANGSVEMNGSIADQEGVPAGQFTKVIPRPPRGQERWVASGKGFAAWGYSGRGRVDRTRRGLGRAQSKRLFQFLADLGVDRYEIEAGNDGSYVWPHIGFDFADDQTRDSLKAELVDWLGRRQISLSDRKRAEVATILHAWDLSEFTDDEGVRRGEEFLKWWGRSQRGWNAAFSLAPDYGGWRMLHKLPQPTPDPRKVTPVFFPGSMSVGGVKISGPQDPRGDSLLADLFKRGGVTFASLLEAFRFDPPHRLSQLELVRGGAGVLIHGLVHRGERDFGGNFIYTLPILYSGELIAGQPARVSLHTADGEGEAPVWRDHLARVTALITRLGISTIQPEGR